MNKPGEYELCPCGSGKKYQQCCSVGPKAEMKPSNVQVVDFAWNKLKTVKIAVFDKHLMPYLTQELPHDFIEMAIDDLVPEELFTDNETQEALLDQFFMPWLLFNWIPGKDFGVNTFNPEITIAENYAILYRDKLSKSEYSFINAMQGTHYSFYTVLEVEAEKTITVQDLLLETIHTVKEQDGTYDLNLGDIIFSRILHREQQEIFVGLAPFVIAAEYNSTIIAIREQFIKEFGSLTAELLYDLLDLELLECFFDMIDIHSTATPEQEPNLSTVISKLLGSSDMQQTIQDMFDARYSRWDKWLNEPIMALDQQTPKNAAKTAVGREQIEALLMIYGSEDLGVENTVPQEELNYLRAELGLKQDVYN